MSLASDGQAALYLRSSKDRKDASIDAQRRNLEELAQARGLQIVEVFSDAVESGKTENRPAFLELGKALKSRTRKWSCVLVYDTSRIARNVFVAEAFKHECKKQNVRILYSALPEINPLMDAFIPQILQAVDELHSMMSKEKGLAGMAENVMQGFRAGGRAPIGYKLEYTETGAIREGAAVTKSKLVVDPEKGPAIAAYLKGRAEGLSAVSLMSSLGLTIAKSSLVGIEWNALTYAGHTAWNVHSEKSADGGYVGGHKRRPRGDWILNKNTHPALISEEQAEAILRRLAASKKGNRDGHFARTGTYLLSGMLVTPDGDRWHGNAGYYRCKTRQLKQNNVEEAVLQKLFDDLRSDEFALTIATAYKAAGEEHNPARELAKLDAKLAKVSKKIENLTNTLGSTTATKSILAAIERCEEEQNLLIEECANVRTMTVMSKTLRETTEESARRMINALVEGVDFSNLPSLQLAVQSLLTKIVLDADTLEAELHFKMLPVRDADYDEATTPSSASYTTGETLASPRGFEPLYSP
jgi:site-specific DNA recombinase